MSTIQFCRATNPTTPEVVHINPHAVLFVEAALEAQIGETLIQVLGQNLQGVRVVESLANVLQSLPDSIAARRHYHAGSPQFGESIIHIYANNIASIVPNTPHDPLFWTIVFTDQFMLRVMAPLPPGL